MGFGAVDMALSSVMPGLDPGIHVFLAPVIKTWMAGTRLAMTESCSACCKMT
jgi:hypothetical protein